MGMTITEKILSAHTGNSEVKTGDLINAQIDIALGNDITAPISIELFKKSVFLPQTRTTPSTSSATVYRSRRGGRSKFPHPA